jgi:hypothetical protein
VETGVDSDNDGVADEFDPHPDSNIDTDADGLSDDFEDVVSETRMTGTVIMTAGQMKPNGPRIRIQIIQGTILLKKEMRCFQTLRE